MDSKIHKFTGQRIVTTTKAAFDTVVERLRRETNPNGLPQSEALQPSRTLPAMTRPGFVASVQNRIGSSEFMYFHEFEYGSWTNLFGVGGGLKEKRFIIGNPLIAITMLKHDRDAALCVPVELLLKELEGSQGTEVIYNLPSSLILIGGVAENSELCEAVLRLDEKLANLVQAIAA